MEALKILEKPADVSWEYDEEADVLYRAVGEPRSTMGVDIGEGTILRYNEDSGEVVGLTVMGVRARLLESLGRPQGGQPDDASPVH